MKRPRPHTSVHPPICDLMRMVLSSSTGSFANCYSSPFLARMHFWSWLCLLQCVLVSPMLHKTKRSYDPAVLPPDERLARNIVDLWATNTVSAARAQEMLDDAASANVTAAKRYKSRTRNKKNIARGLKTRLLKASKWPPLYKAMVRVKDTKTGMEVLKTMSFNLPHELLATLAKYADKNHMLSKEGLDSGSKEHLLYCEAKAGRPLVGLGLWGDGAPCNWDRSEALEVFSLNIPGLGDANKSLRIPITGLSKKSLVTEHTFDDVLEVVAWSLRWAALGKFPLERHDGVDWHKSDKWRSLA